MTDTQTPSPSELMILRAVAEALLSFASKEQAHMAGVLITPEYCVATNGHVLIRVTNSAATLAAPKFFPSQYVKRQIAEAKDSKSAHVILAPSESADVAYPPWDQVIPEPRFDVAGPVGLDMCYLAQLTKASKAAKALVGSTALAITAMGGALEPIRLDSEQNAVTVVWAHYRMASF